MIITGQKPYGIVRGMLRKWKPVGLISCNSCARVCETGGKERMEELAERLKADGFNVVSTELVPLVCNIDAVKRSETEAEYLIVLACDAGVFTVSSVYPNKIVVPANDTKGIGARDGEGNLYIMKKI